MIVILLEPDEPTIPESLRKELVGLVIPTAPDEIVNFPKGGESEFVVHMNDLMKALQNEGKNEAAYYFEKRFGNGYISISKRIAKYVK